MSIFWRHGNYRFALQCLSVWLGYASFLASDAEATGSDYQNVQIIREKVVQALELRMRDSGIEHYQIDIQTLDGRLRLAACNQKLKIKPSNSTSITGRQSVEVRCTGNKPWKIYLQAHIHAEIDAPVLIHALPTGVTISATDIETKRIPLRNSSQPIIRHIHQLLGKRTKQHLNPGQPILVSQLVAPHLVRRGQQVSLEYELNGLKVSMAGQSNQDGSLGDWIKVKNIRSGKIVEGRVNASGNVSVRN